jgi:hypothetical protein
MKVKGKEITGRYERTVTLAKDALNNDERSVELSFSSEEPYERLFGTEVLGHSDTEINLSRLESGTHPLLLQHDDRQQIGVVDRAWVGDDKKGRAVVRFAPSTNTLAETIWQDVKAGIRSLVSVGYKVDEFRKEENLGEDGKPIEGSTVFRAVDWTPFEVSVVSLAADPTVGVGRSDEEAPELEPETIQTKGIDDMKDNKTEPAIESMEARVKMEQEAAERAELAARQEQEKIAAIEKQAESRMREIFAIAKRFKADDLRKTAVEEGWTVEKFRAAIMDKINPGTIIQNDDVRSQANQSPGELFVSSRIYKEYGPRVGSQRSIAVEVPHAQMQFRASPFGQGSSFENLTNEQKLPGVRFVIEDSYTNAAAALAESGTYATVTLAVSDSTATVEKVAGIVKVTDEMLADQAAMRGYIDGRLSYMVQATEENYLLNGTGATNQITGLFTVSGINSIAATSYSTVADAFGHSLNQVRTNGNVEPTAIIMHPNDWTNLILTKDGNGQYYAGGPFTGAYGVGGYSNVGRMFGLPVVTTTFCTQGTALVGSFTIGCQIFRRAGVMIEATNSEASDFINGRVTVRAQSRMTLACYKPLAFCEITAIA